MRDLASVECTRLTSQEQSDRCHWKRYEAVLEEVGYSTAPRQESAEEGVTMKNKSTHGISTTAIVVMGLILMVVAGVLSSTVMAAQTRDATDPLEDQPTLLDPYACEVIPLAVVARSSSHRTEPRVMNRDSGSWRRIRIPSRPPKRSAFIPRPRDPLR